MSHNRRVDVYHHKSGGEGCAPGCLAGGCLGMMLGGIVFVGLVVTLVI